mgnify:CR=1 FL=1
MLSVSFDKNEINTFGKIINHVKYNKFDWSYLINRNNQISSDLGLDYSMYRMYLTDENTDKLRVEINENLNLLANRLNELFFDVKSVTELSKFINKIKISANFENVIKYMSILGNDFKWVRTQWMFPFYKNNLKFYGKIKLVDINGVVNSQSYENHTFENYILPKLQDLSFQFNDKSVNILLPDYEKSEINKIYNVDILFNEKHNNNFLIDL